MSKAVLILTKRTNMKKVIRWIFTNVVPVLEMGIAVLMFFAGIVFTTIPMTFAIAAIITNGGVWCTGHIVAIILLTGSLVSLIVSVIVIRRDYKMHGCSALELSELFPHLLMLGWWWVVLPLVLCCAAFGGLCMCIERLKEWSYSRDED